MPTLPLPKCSIPICNNRVARKGKYFCLDHLAEKTGQHAPGRVRDRFYDSSTWRNLRARFLLQNPLCANCLKKGFTMPATVLDHIIRRRAGGSDYGLENLQGLCADCHNRKRGKERHENKKARW